jgi:tRNA (uracil-5-)-methyltransferase TRM9
MLSSKNKETVDLNEFHTLTPEEYEKKHVHNVYNQIAPDFDHTRYKTWPKVEAFLQSLSQDSVMVEVGCGNGKNLGVSPGKSLGCDICPEFVEIAKKKGYDVKCCDALDLKYDDNYADAVISIAVIHHLATPERRIKAIQEMLRVLKPGGKMMIYVWDKQSFNLDNNEIFVGWKKTNGDGINFKRYYHFFEKEELQEICLKAGDCVIEDLYFDQENWCVVARKCEKK